MDGISGIGMVLFAGLLVGLGLMSHALKLGVRRLAGYDIYVDVMLSFGLILMFHGTFSGMMIASIGGLIISGMLRLIRWTVGYQQLGFYKVPYKFIPFLKPVTLPRLVWFDYPPLHAVPQGETQKSSRKPILT